MLERKREGREGREEINGSLRLPVRVDVRFERVKVNGAEVRRRVNLQVRFQFDHRFLSGIRVPRSFRFAEEENVGHGTWMRLPLWEFLPCLVLLQKFGYSGGEAVAQLLLALGAVMHFVSIFCQVVAIDHAIGRQINGHLGLADHLHMGIRRSGGADPSAGERQAGGAKVPPRRCDQTGKAFLVGAMGSCFASAAPCIQSMPAMTTGRFFWVSLTVLASLA